MTKILFFDVETTGLDSKIHGIHQLSGLIEIDGEVKETFDFNINPAPHLVIDPDALKISGKSIEQIRQYPSEAEVYRAFIFMLSKHIEKFNNLDKAFLAGWNNAHFDNDFLRAFFIRNNDKFFGSWFWSNSIDVMVLATQYLIEQRPDMINFKLMTVATYLLGHIDQTKLHDASYDIELTRNIYQIVKS
jgi:DNA polymerase-3 subunit epsilon